MVNSGVPINEALERHTSWLGSHGLISGQSNDDGKRNRPNDGLYIHTCTHTDVHTYMHTHRRAYIHAHTQTYIHRCTHTDVYITNGDGKGNRSHDGYRAVMTALHTDDTTELHTHACTYI